MHVKNNISVGSPFPSETGRALLRNEERIYCLISWKVKDFRVGKCSDGIFIVWGYETQSYPSDLCFGAPTESRHSKLHIRAYF